MLSQSIVGNGGRPCNEPWPSHDQLQSVRELQLCECISGCQKLVSHSSQLHAALNQCRPELSHTLRQGWSWYVAPAWEKLPPRRLRVGVFSKGPVVLFIDSSTLLSLEDQVLSLVSKSNMGSMQCLEHGIPLVVLL